MIVHIVHALAVLGGAMLLVTLLGIAAGLCYARGSRHREYFCLHCGELLSSGRNFCDACNWLLHFQTSQHDRRWLHSLEAELDATRHEMRKKSC
jgi:hypothetical protein